MSIDSHVRNDFREKNVKHFYEKTIAGYDVPLAIPLKALETCPVPYSQNIYPATQQYKPYINPIFYYYKQATPVHIAMLPFLIAAVINKISKRKSD